MLRAAGRPAPGGEVLFHARNDAVECAGKVVQEGEYRFTGQLVFHQREPHQVQAKIGRNGGRGHRLAEPVQVGRGRGGV
jgi:hypothetical protein